MKRILLLTGLLLLPLAPLQAATGPATTAAADAPASEASVRQLMVETESRKLLDSIHAQVDASLEAGMKAGLGDTKLTPSQQKIMDDMRRKMGALLQDELSWEHFEPLIVDVYRQSFSQKEVDGMLAFYRSEAGRAVIAKMPHAMEITMKRTQQMVADMNPKMQKIIAEMLEAIKADAEQQKSVAKP